MKKIRIKDFFVDVFVITLGCFIYALSVTAFTAPNKIVPGGLTGIATVLHDFFGVKIGLMILLMNIPVIILALIIMGWKFVARSISALVLSSVMMDAIDIWLPQLKYIEETPILASIFGGVTAGIGLSLIYMRGAATGGTDIAAKLVNHYKPHMKLGAVMMVFDFMVVVGATVAYGSSGVANSVQLALLDIVEIFMCSIVVDKVMDGFDMGKVMFIVSGMPKEIGEDIMAKMNRGVTMLNGSGAYSGNDKQVLMCAVRRNEAFRLKKIVYARDPAAFIIVGDATQIYGEGFKPIKDEDDK